MEVRDQLLRLVRIQEVVREIRAAHEVVENAPRRLEEIEQRFRERNAEYVGVKERFDALDSDQRTRSGALELLEEQRKKYVADLMQVQNQREYAAMLKEIDAVKAQIAENEEAVLKDLEEIEDVKKDLESRESHIQEERKLVEQERTEVRSGEEAARETITRLEEERRGLEAELPSRLVSTVGRLEAGRQGVFLAEAVDGVCQSCFVRVRPQVFQEIRLASRIHACSNCRRLLYYPPSLEAAQDGTNGAGDDRRSASPVDSDEVRTADGGAV